MNNGAGVYSDSFTVQMDIVIRMKYRGASSLLQLGGGVNVIHARDIRPLTQFLRHSRLRLQSGGRTCVLKIGAVRVNPLAYFQTMRLINTVDSP